MGSESVEVKVHSSSSDDEDGDEQWKAAINSVVSSSSLGLRKPKPSPTSNPATNDEYDDDSIPHQPQAVKLYQIKAQKALYDIMERSLDVVNDPEPVGVVHDDPEANGGGVRLFKRAPVGIVFDHRDEHKGPKKKPRIRPGEEVDEKSKKFKKRLRSVAVEGMDILAAAKDARQKFLARLEAKQAAAREAAKKEEERVAQLKKVRGERWLPSMAKEMQLKSQRLSTRT